MLFRKFLVRELVLLKINIMGASHYGQFKFVLPEFSQMIHSPGPLVYTLRQN